MTEPICCDQDCNQGRECPLRVKARAELTGAQPARCKNCDGTGDVHSADGEWRGACDCKTIAQPVQPAPAEQGDAKDAERYRWLAPRLRVRKMQPVSGAVRDGIEVKLGCSFIDSNIKKEIETFKLDAAIDAAILAKPGGTET